jgi:hypothetical protein
LVAINVQPTMLGEMLLEMDEPLPRAGSAPRGISTTSAGKRQAQDAWPRKSVTRYDVGNNSGQSGIGSLVRATILSI